MSPTKKAEPSGAGDDTRAPKAGSAGKTAKKHPTSGAGPGVFPIVGLGASAGGLEALQIFFEHMPADANMAFVVVVHHASGQKSILSELIQKRTAMRVEAARDGEALAPNRVYVCPPDKELALLKGKIQLLDVIKSEVHVLPIDFFFRSLAEDQGRNAACIVLSGTASDGALGLKEIKAHDGLVIAQSPETAKYDGMPHNAIRTGVVDLIVPPEEMPAKLVQYFMRAGKISLNMDEAIEAKISQDWLNKVYILLRNRTKHDFSVYKKNTIVRRITRRMGIQQIDDYAHYIRYLRENPLEIDALFKEILIGVTSFFRDPEAFEILSRRILPKVFETMGDSETFRVWVAGCSTGEEAYTLGIVIQECLEEMNKKITPQIFGTDIDAVAIEKAREGWFPLSIAGEVSPERLNRFFIKDENTYRIKKEIRDHVVFSLQDILRDPPFSRLNLLCCRNLLIYLDIEAQRKILPLFHYALKPKGLMLLGSSETIGGFSNIFETIEGKWKIFQRREAPSPLRPAVTFPTRPGPVETLPGPAAFRALEDGNTVAAFSRKILLEEFAPAAAIVDAKGNIQYIHGRTGKYLETPQGPPSQNIVDMARDGLRIELASALRSAVAGKKTVVRKDVQIQTDGRAQSINLIVKPLSAPLEPADQLMVVFQDIEQTHPEPAVIGKGGAPRERNRRIAELERELLDTRESHQTAVEELETSNEELKSINEELQSSNEELQSTNEELESSKEELQSLNEELQTVNAEFQSKIDELAATHDDMRNLLNSTHIATIFLDNNRNIKRFTHEATRIVNLIQSDVGRPIDHMVTNLQYDKLIEDIDEVLARLGSRETDVQTRTGQWYLMRILPYRTADNKIDGVVLTFVNIDEQKKAAREQHRLNKELKAARGFVRSIFDAIPQPMAVVAKDLKVVTANASFFETFGATREKTEGCSLFDLGLDFGEKSGLKDRVLAALDKDNTFEPVEVEMKTGHGLRKYLIEGNRVGRDHADSPTLLLRMTQASGVSE